MRTRSDVRSSGTGPRETVGLVAVLVRSAWDLGALAALSWALIGCSGAKEAEPVAANHTVAAPLHSAERTLPDLRGRLLLDVDADRILLGSPLPAPLDADPMMAMTVSLLVGGEPTVWPLDGRVLSHARLLPDGAIGITASGELLAVDSGTGRVAHIDEGAVGPVGASTDGRILVYCKGEAPSLEVWRADRSADSAPWGAPVPVTQGMAPAWSPAVSPTGAVVFASSRSGVAALWRVDDGAPRQITSRGVHATPGQPPRLDPFPASLTPTLFDGTHIVFEGQQGVVALSGDGQMLRELRGSVPHRISPQVYGVVSGGRVVVLDLRAVSP